MSGGLPAVLALWLCGGQAPEEDPFERREVDRLAGLLETLPASERNSRVVALQDLRDIGAPAGRAAPAVIRLLKDRDASVRRAAAGALEEVRARPDLAVPALLEALKDPHSRVREAAASALKEYPEQAAALLPRLAVALEDPESGVRAAAASALALDTSGKYVPEVIKKLADDDERVRSVAAQTLGALGTVARGAEPVLLEMLKKEQDVTLCSVAHTLWRVSGKAGHAIEVLTKVIESTGTSSEDGRILALVILEEMGEGARSALPAITKSLADESLLVRCDGARTLLVVGKGMEGSEERAVRALLSILREEDAGARRASVYVLSEVLSDIRSPDHGVVPALREALKDKDGVVRVHAAQLLWGFHRDREAAKAVAMEALGEETGFASVHAAEFLGEMGVEAADAIPKLLELREHEWPDVRRAAREALKRIGALEKPHPAR